MSQLNAAQPAASGARLTKLQQALLSYIEDRGGHHVYLGPTTTPTIGSALEGYTWEGVWLSLSALVRRGLLTADRDAFFTIVRGGAGAADGATAAMGMAGVAAAASRPEP